MEVFASLGNETRLRCLQLAATHGEVCVCEVVEALAIPQPTVSKALKSLKEAGLLTDRRDASWIYYRLDESMPAWLATIVRVTVDELSRSQACATDEQRFARSRVRVNSAC